VRRPLGRFFPGPEDEARTLKMLRRELRCHECRGSLEYRITGSEGIRRWLKDRGYTGRGPGGLLSDQQLRHWRTAWACPVVAPNAKGRKRVPLYTTNYLLTAWLLGRGSYYLAPRGQPPRKPPPSIRRERRKPGERTCFMRAAECDRRGDHEKAEWWRKRARAKSRARYRRRFGKRRRRRNRQSS
jgi:hypothetical protein